MPPRDFHGIAATYARVASSAARWAPQCGERTLVIADEAHHLGEELAWGEGFARAFAATPRWLLLSGTPFRSDGSAIAGVRYDDGVAVPDVSYTYADAVREGICRPVVFVPYDGDAVVAIRRRGHRVLVRRQRAERARGRPPLPDRDLDRAHRRPAADPARGRRAARADPRRRAPRRRRPRRDRGRWSRAPRRGAAEGDHGPLADRRRAHRRARGRQAARLRRRAASAGSSQ